MILALVEVVRSTNSAADVSKARTYKMTVGSKIIFDPTLITIYNKEMR